MERQSITLRPASEADVPAVVELVREVLAEFGITFGVGSDTDEQLRALPGSYTQPGGGFWVAEQAGPTPVLLGTCGLYPLGAGVFELRKMYLAPRARGAGLGQRLLDVALAFGRERGGHAVVLDTTERMTAAIRLYERNGFVRDDACIRASRCSRGYRLSLAAR